MDAHVGWSMAAVSFLPSGRIHDEWTAAVAEAEAGTHDETFLSFCQSMDITSSLALSRSLVKVSEDRVQESWNADVRRWWPDIINGAMTSTNERPEKFPLPLLIAKSSRVDYLRKLVFKGAPYVLAVAELKSTLYHPVDGVPQALVSAFSAAADLRAKGLPLGDCVVPFITHTGVLEQHGVAYLLEPCLPCAVLTSPVLDLTDLEGQRRAVSARWAFRRIAEHTASVVNRFSVSSPTTTEVALDLSVYFCKKPLPFVGPRVEHSVLHQLRLFESLRGSPAANDVILPIAVLMQHPVEGSGWSEGPSIVFPRWKNFFHGVPLAGVPLRGDVLAALRAALRRLHAAGVVHLDLFPGNILWRVADGTSVIELRLVDFDAALFSSQLIPERARDIVERNGHTGSYHPDLFASGQRARPIFDWWHFALLSDVKSPFGSATGDLGAWLAENKGSVMECAESEESKESEAARSGVGEH